MNKYNKAALIHIKRMQEQTKRTQEQIEQAGYDKGWRDAYIGFHDTMQDLAIVASQIKETRDKLKEATRWAVSLKMYPEMQPQSCDMDLRQEIRITMSINKAVIMMTPESVLKEIICEKLARALSEAARPKLDFNQPNMAR